MQFALEAGNANPRRNCPNFKILRRQKLHKRETMKLLALLAPCAALASQLELELRANGSYALRLDEQVSSASGLDALATEAARACGTPHVASHVSNRSGRAHALELLRALLPHHQLIGAAHHVCFVSHRLPQWPSSRPTRGAPSVAR